VRGRESGGEEGGVAEAQILPPTSAKPKVKTSNRARHIAREILETIGLTLVIFFAIHFSIQASTVHGVSMQPGLQDGEWVMVNYWSYRFGSPQRGDVIVFKPPISIQGADYLVKRIIAVPGDTISINTTSVFVNGKQLSEPYIKPLPADAQGIQTVTGVVSNLKLQKDQYWVMGDNRRDSLDSRSFGVITRQEIVGKAEVIAWPLNELKWLPTYSSTFVGASH
jgi:signal peptidase I